MSIKSIKVTHSLTFIFSSHFEHLVGITPFPYKVAKSLDQNIYRNVEFDSWNEERKILKQKQLYKVSEIHVYFHYISILFGDKSCWFECISIVNVNIFETTDVFTMKLSEKRAFVIDFAEIPSMASFIGLETDPIFQVEEIFRKIREFSRNLPKNEIFPM